ncbi:MAG TPA: hypothetical protein VGC18_12400 [Lacisediminihabitans sp.]|uniref:hypothetical protein n=1 Tax=Lacisediminihabitans sp. TaxID=2787631 RepID=UPI002ED8CCB1
MSAGFGIGAQVVVRDVSEDDRSPWPDEPSGVIVRAGGSAIAGVWGRAARSRMWWVEFDEPQTDAAGDGPFPSAQVPERYLELAPVVAD